MTRAVNTDSALLVLTALYAGAPIVLKLAAVACMWRFPLDRNALEHTETLSGATRPLILATSP